MSGGGNIKVVVRCRPLNTRGKYPSFNPLFHSQPIFHRHFCETKYSNPKFAEFVLIASNLVFLRIVSWGKMPD